VTKSKTSHMNSVDTSHMSDIVSAAPPRRSKKLFGARLLTFAFGLASLFILLDRYSEYVAGDESLMSWILPAIILLALASVIFLIAETQGNFRGDKNA